MSLAQGAEKRGFFLFSERVCVQIDALQEKIMSVQTDSTVSQQLDVAKPRMFQVVMLNDDFTPMDFVVFVLEHVFDLNGLTAEHLMMQVHEKGSGVAGVYSKDIAESKVQKAMALAEYHGHPFRCVCEPA